ncbi:hypothetical protein ACFL5Z_17935 [Planctomycetota bacterium]
MAEFRREIQQKEKALKRFEAQSYDLKLYPNGMLRIASKKLQGEFPIAEQALPDVARIPKIPAPFFIGSDGRLRSACFNYCLRTKAVPNKPVQVVLRDGVIDRILNSNLLPVPRLDVVNAVLNAKPENVQQEDLKVIKYAWNGHFDVSIIAPTLNCQPRKDNVVAFGVNISEGRDGSIQIQGAIYRLWCLNGAVNRVCDSRQHPLRRPINHPDRLNQFLVNILVFAREAWNQCEEQKVALPKLTGVPIHMHERGALRSRLRQAPFFLSARIITRVIQRLEFEVTQHQEDATVYDLYNAMSFLGTHNQEFSDMYRTRLRLGAGEFTRHEPKICSACRQLMFNDGKAGASSACTAVSVC